MPSILVLANAIVAVMRATRRSRVFFIVIVVVILDVCAKVVIFFCLCKWCENMVIVYLSYIYSMFMVYLWYVVGWVMYGR
jgi:hypothetical protein